MRNDAAVLTRFNDDHRTKEICFIVSFYNQSIYFPVLEKQKKETLNQSIERERKRGNILSLLLKYNQLDFSTNISKQLEIHPCKFFQMKIFIRIKKMIGLISLILINHACSRHEIYMCIHTR